MARGVNKVILIGNLGNDPEVRATNTGNSIATLSVATSESWKDRNTGQQQERTEWHRVVIFGRLAEIAQQYLRKGSKVFLEGKLQTRKWQDQSGQDRYTTEIVIDGFTGQLQMLDNRQEGMMTGTNPTVGHSGMAAAPAGIASPSVQPPSPVAPTSTGFIQSKQPVPAFDDFDDDIPF